MSSSCGLEQSTNCVPVLYNDICLVSLNHVTGKMGVCVCIFVCQHTGCFCRQIPDSTSSWADLEFRGFKVLTNDRVGDRTVQCMHKHRHTHKQMYAHMLKSLLDAYAPAADTNTYFPLCYSRIPVIVHMQCQLSKHVEQQQQQKMRTREGEGLLNRHWQKPSCLWSDYSEQIIDKSPVFPSLNLQTFSWKWVICQEKTG